MLSLLSLSFSTRKGGGRLISQSFALEALHSLIYWGQVTTVETLAWDKSIFYGAKVFTWAPMEALSCSPVSPRLDMAFGT